MPPPTYLPKVPSADPTLFVSFHPRGPDMTSFFITTFFPAIGATVFFDSEAPAVGLPSAFPLGLYEKTGSFRCLPWSPAPIPYLLIASSHPFRLALWALPAL